MENLDQFLPHGFCIKWAPGLLWTYLISDSLIFLAYFAIPSILFYFARHRQDAGFKRLLTLFGAFILACGASHLMSVITLWYPFYWLDAALKAITAVISVITLVYLIPRIPLLVLLPDFDQLLALNHQLKAEIAARKASEDIIRKERDLRQQLINALPGVFYAFDASGKFLLWNRHLETITGYPQATIAHMHPLQFIVDDDQAATETAIQQAFASGHATIEAHLRNQDGDALPYLFNGVRIEIDDQPILVGLGVNISTLKQLENQWQTSEAMFRAIIDASPVPYSLNDDQQRITYLNPAFIETFGYTLSDIPTLADWWPKAYPDPEYRQWVATSWQACLEKARKENAPFKPMELNIRGKDGAMHTALGGVALLGDRFDGTHLVILYDITDRKQSENALRDSEFRWKFAIEGSGEGLWDWNVADSKVFFSKIWKEMLGYAESEIGNGLDEWEKRIHPEDRETTLTAVRDYLDGKTPLYANEHRVRCKDGTYKWILDRGMVVSHTEEGKPLRMIGTHTDISARKQAELALRDSEEKLQAVLNASEIAIAWADENGIIEYINPKFTTLFGYTLADIPNLEHWYQRAYPDPVYREKVIDQWHTALTGSLPERPPLAPMDLDVTCKDGSIRHVILMGSWAGTRLLANFSDITERKRIEDKLRQSEERLKLATRAGGIGTWDYDVLHDKLLWDESMFSLYGVKREDFSGAYDAWYNLVHPEDRSRGDGEAQAALQGAKPLDTEFRVIGADGAVRHIKAIAEVFHDEQGKPLRAVGVNWDITDLKNMQARLERDAVVSKALAGLSKALIAPATQIQEVSDVVLSVARALTDSEHGYVSFIDPETGDNISHTLTAMMEGDCALPKEQQRIAFKRGADGTYPKLWGHALNTRQGFYTNRPAEHVSSKGTPVGHIPLHGFLTAPALLEDQLVGQIALANPSRPYTDADLAIIDQIAVIYATALQRKRIEEALAENEQRFRAVFEYAAAGIARVSTSGHFLQINPEFCHIVGYSQEEILSRALTFQQITHPDDLTRDLEWVNLLLTGENDHYTLEKRYIHKNGGIVWVILSVYLLRDSEGKPLYFISAVQDITARRQDEERLRLAATVFENSGEAIMITDTDNQILSVNPAFTAITGYSAEEVRGKSPSLFKSGRHPQHFYTELWQCLNETGYWRGELWDQRKNGEAFPTWQVISAVRNPHGEIANYVALFADVTEYHRIEQELIAARDAAHASAQAKSAFLANMSHEIRTPMNGIIGLTQLALEQPLSSTVRDYLHKVHDASDSLLSILNDILDYSKIEAKQMVLDNNPFHLDLMLEHLRNLFIFRAEEKSLSLIFQVDDDVPRGLVGDELRLQQVLVNLLGNALKFTAQGSVTLSITCVDKTPANVRLKFRITDTGIGMSQETISHLFQPFTQADGSITRRFGGTGLGLAISRQILLLFGSEFVVASQPERGTDFSFDVSLSLASASQCAEMKQRVPQKPAGADLKSHARAAGLTGLRVLVAEDNLVNQQVVAGFLGLMGIQFCMAGNGHEALTLLEREKFDAVLMDVHMPEMNGLEATRRLRQDERFAALPIIALTAGVTTDEREQALACGMQEFLAKPVNAQALLDTLSRCLAPGSTTPPQLEQPTHSTDQYLQLPGFDMETLNEIMEDQAAVIDLLLLFRQNTRKNLAYFEEKLEAGELAEAELYLHQIKGAAGSVGAKTLQKAAEALDAVLKQGLCPQDLLDALRMAYGNTEDALKNLSHDNDDS